MLPTLQSQPHVNVYRKLPRVPREGGLPGRPPALLSLNGLTLHALKAQGLGAHHVPECVLILKEMEI